MLNAASGFLRSALDRLIKPFRSSGMSEQWPPEVSDLLTSRPGAIVWIRPDGMSQQEIETRIRSIETRLDRLQQSSEVRQS